MKHCVVSALQIITLDPSANWSLLWLLYSMEEVKGRAVQGSPAGLLARQIPSRLGGDSSSLATSLKWLEIFQNRCLVNPGNMEQQCITYLDVFRISNGGNG